MAKKLWMDVEALNQYRDQALVTWKNICDLKRERKEWIKKQREARKNVTSLSWKITKLKKGYDDCIEKMLGVKKP